MSKHYCRRGERGFTVIEALITLLVVAFGMLALAGMQIMLSRNSDVAKQRSEATRLAQEKMECLRSFSQITTAAAGTANCNGAMSVLAWNGLATTANDASNPITSSYSNTSYSRSWTVGGATADALRPVQVTVTWTDRAGATQSVVMGSVIAQSDPKNAGSLGFPLPQNTNLKRPKNRNLDIPVPATDLGGGKSVYQINSSLAIVFSNDSGFVIERCNTTVTAANYANNTAGCVAYDAYIVAGYISGANSTALGTPTGINTSSVTGWDSSGGKTISCSIGTATNQNTEATLSGFRYYLCIIPVTSGGTWGGRIRLAGMTTGNSASNWLVCRFEYPASTIWTNANERNVQPYVSVNGSLDSQNYYIASSNSSAVNPCPTFSTTVGNGPSAQTFSITTQLQQNCRTSNSSNYATDCPTTFSGP